MSWKILLADDDREDWEIIKDAFENLDAGDSIQFTENGKEAISLLNSEYEKGNIPALVILDLNMPILNGTQTLQIIKSDGRFKDVTVIIYSTSVNPIEKEKCLMLGANSYVTKPVSVKESVEIAQQFLTYVRL